MVKFIFNIKKYHLMDLYPRIIQKEIINIIGDEISIYSDLLMSDNNIIKGRKQDSDKIWICTSPKTANMMYETYKQSLRKKKLERICNGKLN